METPKAPDSPNREDEELARDAAVREAEAFSPGEEPGANPAPGRQGGRIARSTAFFSAATAASRIAGLGMHPYAAKQLVARLGRTNLGQLQRATATLADLEVWCRGGTDYGDELALTIALRRAAAGAA